MVLRLISLLFVVLAAAPSRGAPLEVDVELFLAVDVSRSMAPSELEIQRRGYAEALTSDAVMNAIGEGMLGRIAVTYVEWAGEASQTVVIPWTVIAGPDDARAIAGRLAVEVPGGMRRTSISGAIDYGRASIAANAFQGLRRVIDISGDGPNNDGRPVLDARARALAEGIVINGLPLMTWDGVGGRWQIQDLDRYYHDCVIGGPGAFMVPVLDWAQFAEAVRRKLVLEIAALPAPAPAPGAIPRAIPALSPFTADCLIGEKLRRQRERLYDMP